jgi:HAD superfamily hydrolase (TIGR01509 family)
MTKVILFDFWGTIVEQGIQSPIKQVKRILNIKLAFPEYVVRMQRAMMTEKFLSLEAAFVNVCKEFNIPPAPDVLAELVGLWNKNWMLAHPYPGVESSLKDLRKKYHLVLISNTDAVSVESVLEKFKLEELFDTHFLSYKTHLIKTDKSFFKYVLDELRVEVDECVVVGDSMQSDIAPAQQTGIRAILVDRKHQREFPEKITDITQLESIL